MEDVLDDEEKTLSLIESCYVPFIKDAINQLQKTGNEKEKLQKLSVLYEGLTHPLKEDKISHFKENKLLLESLYQRFKKVRELRQKRNSPIQIPASTSKVEDSKMNAEFPSSNEQPPLQNHMACKLCAYIGQYLVKHYVEFHPGAEIPVFLTPKVLKALKCKSESPVQPNISTNQDDGTEKVISFIKNLGQSNTSAIPVTCPECPFSSTLKTDVISHLRIHENSTLKCYFCQVTETNFNDFHDHVSSHTGEYAYQCMHCKFRGISSTDVAWHISQTHPRKEAKTIIERTLSHNGGCLKGYVCSTCGFIQMSKSSVQRHVSSVDLFCRGSYVIEFDLSKGSKGVSSATVVEGSCIPNDTESSEASIARTVSNVNSMVHTKNVGQKRAYIQDEIEIAQPDPHVHTNLPFRDSNNSGIKTEKVDGHNQTFNHSFEGNRPSNAGFPHRTVSTHETNQVGAVLEKTVTFTCASCHFSTVDEEQFIKHAKTDHRSDLSLWCKNCGKCFSNAGVLVIHIKENSCIKKNMIYRCGVKDCSFDTSSGQTFVHHLRHCHKGSAFIFCVHCHKIFTLPHCLILHMQNDCPHKERNVQSLAQSFALPVLKPPENITAVKPFSTPPTLQPSAVTRNYETADPTGSIKVTTDNCDSNPDDPSWASSDTTSHSLLCSPEKFHECACCQFSGNCISALEDHYLTSHKEPGKTRCLKCNLKFESTQSFLEHFVLHEKKTGSDDNYNKLGGISQAGKKFKEKANTLSPSVEIPYQAAIHEKPQKDGKPRNFEDVKSQDDLSKMKEPFKLKHFFKCMFNNCSFTTDNNHDFISHLNDLHHGNQLFCPFCFKEYISCTLLVDHMIDSHGRRCYQCSACFYRAFSKPHVQIHIKVTHSKEKGVKVFTSTAHLSHLPPSTEWEKDKNTLTTDKSTWPYRCAIGGCKFQTFEPNEFRKHNEITHRAVSVFPCSYCKSEFLSFKRLMNHYRIHGINNYQCTYCLHGSDTKEEILTHLSLNHSDLSIRIHVRAPQDSPFVVGSRKKPTTESSSIKSEDKHFQKNYSKSVKVPEPQVDDKPPNPESKLCIPKINNAPALLTKFYPELILNYAVKFTCGIPNCNNQFETANLYLKHLKHIHLALNVICPYCYEAIESESGFKDHLLFHGPNLYACSSDMCVYYHWNENEVIKHTKHCHGKQLDIVTVRKSSTSEPIISIPEIDCADPNQKSDYSKGSLSCPFCNYKTYNRVMLKKHIYLEFGYVRFQCCFCKHRCSNRKDLLSHYLSNHPNGSIFSYMDINVEIEYVVKAYIFCLQNLSSGEFEVENSRSSFKVLSPLEGESSPSLSCRDCHKIFTRACDWHKHLYPCLLQHFDEKVLNYVKCNYCEYMCTKRSSLKVHSTISHPGNVPSVAYSENPNRLEWIEEKLVTVRLQFLSFVIGLLIKNCSGLVLSDLQVWQKSFKLESKLYKCCYCSFTDNFRYNVERHLTSSHNDKPIKIERLMKPFFPTGSSLNVCSTNGTFVLDDSMISPVNRKNRSVESRGSVVIETNSSVTVKCAHCSETFLTRYAFYRHSNNAHPLFPVKEFCEIASGSVKRKFMENDHFSTPSTSASDSTHHVTKKSKDDTCLYCCYYCHNIFPSLKKIEAHFLILHPYLPFKYETLSVPLETDVSVRFGVSEFLDNAVENLKKHPVSELMTVHSNPSCCSANISLNKVTLQLPVKSKDRSIKFPVVHLSGKFQLFPNIDLERIQQNPV